MGKKTPTTEFLVTRCMMDYFNCFQVLLILLIEIRLRINVFMPGVAWHEGITIILKLGVGQLRLFLLYRIMFRRN